MAVVFEFQKNDATLLLWHIVESEQELRELVAEEDRSSAARFSNAGRRLEHLAWRAALRERMADAEVGYDQVGAPVLMGSSDEISVAHDRRVAVVVVGKRRNGVDIVSAKRDFSPASSRYISDAERMLPDASHPDFEAIVWSGKEALYKYSGRRGLSLLNDVRITQSNVEQGQLVGKVTDMASVEIDIIRWEEYIISLIV